jgi:hypothetical protein
MSAMTFVSSYRPDPRFKLPAPQQERALESSGLLQIAAERFRSQAREALLATPATRESYHRALVLTAAFKAIERAAAQAYEEAGFPVDALDFTPVDSLDRHAPHLPAALEYVTESYQAALSTVGLGGLIDASSLDAARKAIQHEIAALGTAS